MTPPSAIAQPVPALNTQPVIAGVAVLASYDVLNLSSPTAATPSASLLRSPAFSLVAILTFAVGIGVNTAVFSVFNGVILRSLPYPEADRITMVWMDNRQQNIKEDITSYPNYRDWRDQSSSYAHLAAFTDSAFNLTGADEPERLNGAHGDGEFLRRDGRAADARPALHRSAGDAGQRRASSCMSYGLWQRRFGGTSTCSARRSP